MPGRRDVVWSSFKLAGVDFVMGRDGADGFTIDFN